jgi:hypothetical protein
MSALRDVFADQLVAALHQSLVVDRGLKKFLRKEGIEASDLVQEILDYTPPAAVVPKARAAPKKTRGEQFTADDHRKHLDPDFDAGWTEQKGFCKVYMGRTGDEDGNNKYMYCGKSSKKFRHCCLRHITSAAGKKIIEAEQSGNFDSAGHHQKCEVTREKQHKDDLKELGEPYVSTVVLKGKSDSKAGNTYFAVTGYSADKKLRYESKLGFVILQTTVKGKVVQEVMGYDPDQDGELLPLTPEQYNIVKRKGPGVIVATTALDSAAAKIYQKDQQAKKTLTNGKSMLRGSSEDGETPKRKSKAPAYSSSEDDTVPKRKPGTQTKPQPRKSIVPSSSEEDTKPAPKKKVIEYSSDDDQPAKTKKGVDVKKEASNAKTKKEAKDAKSSESDEPPKSKKGSAKPKNGSSAKPKKEADTAKSSESEEPVKTKKDSVKKPKKDAAKSSESEEPVKSRKDSAKTKKDAAKSSESEEQSKSQKTSIAKKDVAKVADIRVEEPERAKSQKTKTSTARKEADEKVEDAEEEPKEPEEPERAKSQKTKATKPDVEEVAGNDSNSQDN